MKRIVLLLLLLPVAAAQPATFLEVEGPHHFAPGATHDLEFTIAANDAEPLNVLLSVEAPGNWEVKVTPDKLRMVGGEAIVHVSVTAAKFASPDQAEITLEAVLVNATGVDRITATHAVDWRPENLVLGRYDNPLPAPLDGTSGTFAINVVAWLAVAALAVFVVRPAVKFVASRTESTTDDKLVRAFTVPTFILIAVYGLKLSLESFLLPSWLHKSLDTLWIVTVGGVVTYAVFQLWNQVILVVAGRLSKTTESKLDDRLYPLFAKIGGVLIIVGGIFTIINSLGYNMAYFAAGGVAASLVIAFAAQDTLSNFFSGIHILLDQPFTEGDDIMLETGEVCRVDRIGLRSTRLYHRANHEHYVLPNNLLANTRIVNMVHPDTHYKMNIAVGVAYGSDVPKVKELLLEAAREHPLVMEDKDHSPWVWFLNFGDSSLDFKLYVWVEDLYARWAVSSDLREAIDAKFRQHGIEIPFPQRVVWEGKDAAPEVAPVQTPVAEHKTIDEATARAGDD